MLNRRKATIGWLVYTAGKPLAKRALKRKAKSAAPSTAKGKAGVGSVAAAAAATAGALMFWRSRKNEESADS